MPEYNLSKIIFTGFSYDAFDTKKLLVYFISDKNL
jgi:hypothetical protein